jgi:hypothetical protein
MSRKLQTMQAGATAVSPKEASQFTLQPFSYPMVAYASESSIPIDLHNIRVPIVESERRTSTATCAGKA